VILTRVVRTSSILAHAHANSQPPTVSQSSGGDDIDDHDEDVALTAVLAMSGGGTYQGDENLEAQMLACRCLANLMEALPGVAHSDVYHGAIPVLCSKLIEISCIDLAEQTLSVSLSVVMSHSPLKYVSDTRETIRRVH
jgi:hypothetical protein